jgi:hypothetical protein
MYKELIENEIFKRGEIQGSASAAQSIMTDTLLELNSLSLFYQKPSSKSITPKEIESIRANIELVKGLLHTIVNGIIHK